MTSNQRIHAAGSTTSALNCSMQAVVQALNSGTRIGPEQMIARIQEWREMIEEVAGGVSESIELATLYEVSNALNSSLDLTETLNLVIDLLIHLTGAERGFLVLLNDAANLDIQAARNFDQENIAASDLEMSHTVVRNAMNTGAPVLSTNAQVDPRFSDQESIIGYNLRSIICVPMQVRERIIGALYLDNRVQEGAFTQHDASLLTAFANQAAVAIENARLYTSTDQALAARVRELVTLQQVDQELNASLDFDHVLHLTLEWALKATLSKEGTLSIIDDDGFLSRTTTLPEGFRGRPKDADVRQVIDSREPTTLGGNRVLIPIRLEDRTIGLLDLQRDARSPFATDDVKFAGRLADHAAIAIQNARLYEELQQANLAKSEFVSFVAHELRTPMTSIRGYADLLKGGIVGPLTDQQNEFVETIVNNVGRMQMLVSDLHDVSRIETGRIRLETRPTALLDALEGALKLTGRQIEARSQQLVVDVSESLPKVQADPARLEQILANLLSNAYKYTPEAGRISVSAIAEGVELHCTVADTGIGISAEDQDQLFTKYFRSSDRAVREMPGTGLGLCIVKSLVELQGGELRIESQLGEGTAITFTVPVADDDKELV